MRILPSVLFVSTRRALPCSFIIKPISAQSFHPANGHKMTADPSTSRPKRSSSNDHPGGEPSTKKRQNLEDYDADEAITREEIEGTEQTVTISPQAPSKPRNAFSELMSAKPAATKPPAAAHHNKDKKKSSSFRDGLGTYLTNPSFPSLSSQIIFHNDSFVAIRDLYPKSTVHTLLLPRSPTVNRLHPFDALSRDPSFLASVRTEASRLKELVAKELQRRLGRFSIAETKRNAVLDGDEKGQVDDQGNLLLPKGRDWGKEVKVGVHAVPSMNHLHIHVLSRDMHSEKMKHRKHYNSFTTDFFVELDDFPLAEDDWRREKDAQRHWPERPMVCWRCGGDFGNRFKELKGHLEDEFEEWKRE